MEYKEEENKERQEKLEPAIPWIIRKFRNRSIEKKQKQIKELELDIEKAKLEKKLKEIG